MNLNWNPFADAIENIVYPVIFRGTVATSAALNALPNPRDGEVRRVTADEKWYQYQAATTSWVEMKCKDKDSW